MARRKSIDPRLWFVRGHSGSRVPLKTIAMARATKPTGVLHGPARNGGYIGMGTLIRQFIADGPHAIQTNRTVACQLFGVGDHRLTGIQIRKARNEIDRIIRFGWPLLPCGHDGALKDDETAEIEARRGMPRRYRFDPHGAILGDALREVMGEVPAVDLAIGAVALGAAVLTVGCEEAGILLDAIWRAIPPKAFTEAEKIVSSRMREAKEKKEAGWQSPR